MLLLRHICVRTDTHADTQTDNDTDTHTHTHLIKIGSVRVYGNITRVDMITGW